MTTRELGESLGTLWQENNKPNGDGDDDDDEIGPGSGRRSGFRKLYPCAIRDLRPDLAKPSLTALVDGCGNYTSSPSCARDAIAPDGQNFGKTYIPGSVLAVSGCRPRKTDIGLTNTGRRRMGGYCRPTCPAPAPPNTGQKNSGAAGTTQYRAKDYEELRESPRVQSRGCSGDSLLILSSMAPPTKGRVRCVCTAYGCRNKPGGYWYVTSVDLNKHERADEDNKMLAEIIEEQAEERARITKEREELKAHLEAEERQQRLAKQDERERLAVEKATAQARVDAVLEEVQERDDHVAELLSQLSLGDPPAPSEGRQPRYRVEHERRQVDVMAKLLDQQSQLRRDFKQLEVPNTLLGLSRLKAGVLLLDDYLARAHRIKGEISLIRSSSRFASVRTLTDAGWKDAKAHIVTILAAKVAWADTVEELQRSYNATNARTYSTGHLNQSILPNTAGPVQILLYMVTVCSVLLMFPRRGCAWLLGMGRVALDQAFLLAVGSNRTSHMATIVDTFPKDAPNVVQKFRLDTKYTIYAVCPACHHIYPPTDPAAPIPTYREKCNYRRYDRGDRCSAILRRKSRSGTVTRWVPITPFVSFHVKDWLARLVSRTGAEKKMDGSWAKLKKPPSEMSPEELATEELTDIFDGHLVREFKGPDGERHFSVPSIGGFASCSHEWFCSRCLCTRSVLRGSKPIPNPTRRNKYAKERTSQVPAQDESVAFEGGSGNRVGYNNFALDTWKLRTDSGCREAADKYRFATTPAAARGHFNRSGLRWTEFLRLPYFDLPRMLVIDSMHNLFLGLLKEHFRKILGFRSSEETNSKGKRTPASPPALAIDITPSEDNPFPQEANAPKALQSVINALQKPLNRLLQNPTERANIAKKFSKLHVSSAVYLCKAFSCTDLYLDTEKKKPLKKSLLIDKILDWRAVQTESKVEEDIGASPVLITQEEKEALWADMANVSKPSWVTSVPSAFGGTASTGKLKADQWRTLGTVYMPITLIRLWSASEEGSDRRELLALTMDLVSAVLLASSRTSGSLSTIQMPSNHHLALHIPEFLMLFGPVHGWWTFPFERMNGKLQRISTNYKPGQYEATISRQYHRMTNLKLSMTAPSFPPLLLSLRYLVEKLTGTGIRNVFVDDELGFSNPPVARKGPGKAPSTEITQAFLQDPNFNVVSSLPQSIHLFKYATYKGIHYSTQSRHQGNSSIMVPTIDTNNVINNIPMVIQSIFQDVKTGAIFFATQRLRDADMEEDPFQEYPILGARIWGSLNNPEPPLHIVHPSEIICHFASCEMSGKVVTGEVIEASVVLPLHKTIMLEPGYVAEVYIPEVASSNDVARDSEDAPNEDETMAFDDQYDYGDWAPNEGEAETGDEQDEHVDSEDDMEDD
ncbi:hypothetical protein C8R43DRAFT_950548 [Mycena crocata]|nr:hypothetical protein C8R43DRAFT_950548 [Mycena crocata]